MKCIRNILTGAAALLLSLGAQAQEEPIILVENGKSEWHIHVIGGDSAQAAARHIQTSIRSLTGVTLEIVRSRKGRCIVVGTTDDIKRDYRQEARITLNIETDGWVNMLGAHIWVGTDDEELMVWAAREFLMYLNGTEMLAPLVISLTPVSTLRFYQGQPEETSPFTFRMAFYSPATIEEFALWNRLRQVKKTRDSEDSAWGLWVHTMHRFVPPAQFETYPEYFSQRNGVRVPDQLCLSHPKVLRITVDSLRAMMQRKPNAEYWSVSQMDNFNHCQCALCHRTDSIDGSPSGSIIRFANAVADSFPDKVISTLAYQYSRSAPKVTTPRPNVNIMLCSIEEDRSRPIASRDQPGSFTADLRAWSELTHNIIVWDYVINFSHLLAPFPNWKVLAPNLQLFRDNGVPMMFEQGLSSPGGEMPEFRTYLLAKLLWNPDLNVDSLRTHFMNAFYGEAGVYIDKYTRLLEEELDRSGKPLTLYEHPQAHKDGYLSPENIAKYKMLFNSAEAAVMDEDTIYQWRVEDARLGIMYAELEIAKALPGTEHGLYAMDSTGRWYPRPEMKELLHALVERAKKHGHTLFHETRLTPDEYAHQMEVQFLLGAERNLATGHGISFREPPDPKYQGGSAQALIDGFHASDNYQFGWQGWYGTDMVATVDLGSEQEVRIILVDFLQDVASWIFRPAWIRYEYSMDGIHFERADDEDQLIALERTSLPTRQSYSFRPEKPIAARYFRVTAKNLGDLPAWHGSKGQCWLFCDEIVVR